MPAGRHRERLGGRLRRLPASEDFERKRWHKKHHALMPKEPNTNPAPVSPALKALAAEKTGALDTKDSVQTAGDRMREHDAQVWPVTEDCKLVGMVDEKNPDWKLCGHGHDPKVSRVGEIMKRDVIFCFEDEDCAVARRKMVEHGLDVLPVVDRDLRIVGVFTREEIKQKAEAHAGATASGCGFNRSTQRIDEIVQLVSRSLAFSLGVR